MKSIRYIAIFALALAGLTACGELTSALGAEQEGAIMIHLIHKSSYPSGAAQNNCSNPVGGYNDNNPAMPHNAPSGLYGPSQPGEYDATWRWGDHDLSFRYWLSAPEAGHRRTYTIRLMIYKDTLGRCVIGTSSQEYTDERM